MATIKRWSGVEIRALREAKRMSLRDFAAHLGVSERMISKWEAGRENTHPRPINQAALDTCLNRSDPDTKARFVHLIDSESLVSAQEDAAHVAPIGDDHIKYPVDGSAMALVEESLYQSGPSNIAVWLPTYYVDVYPVSNSDYARFVAATGHHAPQHWTDGAPRDQLDHPVVFVTWNDAAAYAKWLGKSLPTSQQWEKAARGTRGTIYPWGDQPTPAKCNVRENGVGSTTPRDCYRSGVSPYGLHDLCGNVWEWCSTETKPSRHELKGGAWTSPFHRATPSAFNDAAVSMCDDDTGFRCVASLEAVQLGPSDQLRDNHRG